MTCPHCEGHLIEDSVPLLLSLFGGVSNGQWRGAFRQLKRCCPLRFMERSVCGKLFGALIVQRTVGAVLVIIDTPIFNDPFCFGQRGEPVQIQTFFHCRQGIPAMPEYPYWSSPVFSPFALIAEQSICHDNQLAHDSGYSEFLTFPIACQLMVFGLHIRIETGGDHRR